MKSAYIPSRCVYYSTSIRPVNMLDTMLSVKIPADRETGTPKGSGFIEIGSADKAQQASNTLNPINLNGQEVVIDSQDPNRRKCKPPQNGCQRSSGGYERERPGWSDPWSSFQQPIDSGPCSSQYFTIDPVTLMTAYTETALHLLKEKGLRITKPRRLVVELLDKSKQALSAYEIKDLLDASGERVDTVSVYRILDCLEENELVHRVLATGKVRKCTLEHEDHCHLPQEEHCHHLLICQKCGSIEEAHCPGVSSLVKELERTSNFQITAHNLEFFGACSRCR